MATPPADNPEPAAVGAPSEAPTTGQRPPSTSAPAADLLSRLAERPYGYHFFQAVRRLECARAELPRTGFSRRPVHDPIRFCQEPSLAFPPATLRKLEPGERGRAPRLFVTFMGLLGPNGPMPLHFTQYARQREMDADHTLARFCDVFNHRMVSLFYRAWAANQQAVQFERGAHREARQDEAPPPAGDEDRFAVYIGSLFGIGMPSLRRRDTVPDVAKLHYSGRLVCQTRHAEGLRAVLEDFFKIQCRITEFFGQWIDVPPDCQCRMGETPRTGTMGRTLICGSRMWDCQQKFRVVFGPMGLDDYQRMLPSGDSLRRFADWVRNYIGEELTCDLQVILRKEEVPEIRMGSFGQLGWTTWLQSKPFDHDADDLVLRPLEAT